MAPPHFGRNLMAALLLTIATLGCRDGASDQAEPGAAADTGDPACNPPGNEDRTVASDKAGCPDIELAFTPDGLPANIDGEQCTVEAGHPPATPKSCERYLRCGSCQVLFKNNLREWQLTTTDKCPDFPLFCPYLLGGGPVMVDACADDPVPCEVPDVDVTLVSNQAGDPTRPPFIESARAVGQGGDLQSFGGQSCARLDPEPRQDSCSCSLNYRCGSCELTVSLAGRDAQGNAKVAAIVAGESCSDFVGSYQSCRPDCDAKTCGDDGCGGSCGSCADDETCSAGICTSSTSNDCASCLDSCSGLPSCCCGSGCICDSACTDTCQ
jgi:hypothetical protein